MKTISEIKDEVAKRKYDSSFRQAITFMNKIDIDYFMDEVAKCYAEEAIKKVAQEAHLTIGVHRYINEEDILNLIDKLK